jgi:hypothetical protein
LTTWARSACCVSRTPPGEPQRDGHLIVDLVRDPACELGHRLQAGLDQPLFGHLPLGDVLKCQEDVPNLGPGIRDAPSVDSEGAAAEPR